MRIEIPSDQHPLVHVSTQIGSPYLRGALQGVTTSLYAADSTVTPKEREAVRYYLAWLLDCNTCQSSRAGRDGAGFTGEVFSDEWYDNIGQYKSWPGYTERERTAIEFCSRTVQDHLDVEADDDLWRRTHEHFDQREVEDLVILSAFIAASNVIREVFLGPASAACAVDASATATTGATQ